MRLSWGKASHSRCQHTLLHCMRARIPTLCSRFAVVAFACSAHLWRAQSGPKQKQKQKRTRLPPLIAITDDHVNGMKREREEDAVAEDGGEEDVPPSAPLNVEDLSRVAGDGGVEEVPPAAPLDAPWEEQPVLDSSKRGRRDVLGGVSDAPSSNKKLHKDATLKVNSRPHTALWVRWEVCCAS